MLLLRSHLQTPPTTTSFEMRRIARSFIGRRACESQQARGLSFAYNEMSPALASAAALKHYPSNIWIADGDLARNNAEGEALRANLLDGQVATVASVEQRTEYYNMCNLVSPPLNLRPVASATVYPTMSKARGRMMHAMNRVVKSKNYHSNYWLTRAAIRKEGLELDYGQSVTVVRNGFGKFYNVSQFTDPTQLVSTPVSGLTRFEYQSKHENDWGTFLRETVRDRGLSCGLMFSPKQLDGFDLVPRPDARPILLPLSVTNQGHASPFALFNVAQLRNGGLVVAKLNRTGTDDVPRQLLTGDPVPDADILTELARDRGYELNFWISQRDVHRFTTFPGQVFSVFGAKGAEADAIADAMQLRDADEEQPYDHAPDEWLEAYAPRYISVDDLEEPPLGFARAGGKDCHSVMG
jgi:hypothetical protein